MACDVGSWMVLFISSALWLKWSIAKIMFMYIFGIGMEVNIWEYNCAAG
jgi:hypothetical protein